MLLVLSLKAEALASYITYQGLKCECLDLQTQHEQRVGPLHVL